ncbi:MAG: FxsA family protein [Micavibrio aeruginosavorus]|uniref:FxsA family protein n=1 Tax=Micavibrio aeruginosavorus TaxID=349221 RepID=A0A7T5R2M0_9BACT|nr:MAG: FxsA family protein [Micavibrio aeruginosavorus]
MTFFAALILLPLIEVSLFIAIGGELGIFRTLLLLAAAGFAGGFILKTQGLNTILAMQAVARRGQVPLQQMFDGFCLVLAGVLLILPGFFTDFLSFALMVPPIRALLRQELIRRYGLPEMTAADESVIDAEFHRIDVERITKDE